MLINNKLIKYIKKEILTIYNYRFKNNDKRRKYDLTTIITEMMYFLKTGLSYSDYGFQNRAPMNEKTLNYYVLLFSKDNISILQNKNLFKIIFKII